MSRRERGENDDGNYGIIQEVGWLVWTCLLSWPAFSGRRGSSTPQAKTLDRDQALILKRSLLNPERSNIRKDYFRTSNDRF